MSTRLGPKRPKPTTNSTSQDSNPNLSPCKLSGLVLRNEPPRMGVKENRIAGPHWSITGKRWSFKTTRRDSNPHLPLWKLSGLVKQKKALIMISEDFWTPCAHGSIHSKRWSVPTTGVRWTIARWILLLLLAWVSPSVLADPKYYLKPPSVYHALGGDLHVNYSTPSNVILPHAFVRLERWSKSENRAVEVQSLGIPRGRHNGTLIFSCGVVEVAGSYTLRMFTHQGGKLLARTALVVRWPDITLSLPTQLTALTSSAELRVISRATCVAKRGQFEFHVRLYHRRSASTSDGSRSVSGSSSSSEVASGATVALTPTTSAAKAESENTDSAWNSAEKISELRLPAVNKTFTRMSLGCHLFDLNGLYRAVLVSTSRDAPPVATSNAMNVTWGHGYQLTVMRAAAFPCSKPLRILYSHPPCSGENDLIRLYSRTRTAAGSPAAPLDRKYVKELKADPNAGEMTLGCDYFSQSASGFCLTYLSVTRGTAITQQTERCFPAYPDSVFPVAGSWSHWTSWGACSVTCGAGKKQRFRLCNSPPPRHGGTFCPGGHVEWKSCVQHCPDTIPRTPLHSPPLDPACPCGCPKSGTNEGRIIATGRCQGLSNWTIRVEHGLEIILHFDYFHLNHTRQFVKIRDGESPNDRLLFSSADPAYPMDIVTSGSVARIEFMTSPLKLTSTSKSTVGNPMASTVFPVNASLPIHVNGFIASYRSTAAPTSTVGPLLFRYREKPPMHSPFTIAGIAICAAAVVVAVAFVIIQRITAKGRPVKHAMAASASTDSPANGEERGRSQGESQDSPAHRQHSSAQSSSPSSHGNAVHVDMEVPLTGKLRRRANSGGEDGGAGKLDKGVKSSRNQSTISGVRQKKKKKKLMVRIDMNLPAVKPGDDEGAATSRPVKATMANAGTSSVADKVMALAPPGSAKSPHGFEVIDTDEISVLKSESSTTPKTHRGSSSPSSKKHHHRHRHRKDGRHNVKPEASSPTKCDLLRKMRQEKRAAADENGGGEKVRSRTPALAPVDLEREVTGSSGSRSPVSVSTTKAEVNWPSSSTLKQPGVHGASSDRGGAGGGGVRAALSEMVGRTFASSSLSSSFSDRHKRSAAAGLGRHLQQGPQKRPPSEEIPLMDSMTSSLESPSHFNAMAKSESQDSHMTSFGGGGAGATGGGFHPARRPTSLTESYNSNVSNDANSPVVESQQHRSRAIPGATASTLPKGSTVIPRPTRPSPSTLTPSSMAILPPPSYSSLTKSSTSKPAPTPLPSSLTESFTIQSHKDLGKEQLPPPLLPITSSVSPKPLTTQKPVLSSHHKKPNESAIPTAKSPITPTPSHPVFDERISSLPKPDGQSPRPNKRESPGSTSPFDPDKTLTRSSNPPHYANGRAELGPSASGNMTPISINTADIVPSVTAKDSLDQRTPNSISPGKNIPATAVSKSNSSAQPSPGLRKGAASSTTNVHDSPRRALSRATPSSQGPPSPGKLSRGSNQASRSNVSSCLVSPARSIPSEVEGLELEYDDFIEDDPLSYFDYEETQKLTFRGKERIGKVPVEEEEEGEEEVTEI